MKRDFLIVIVSLMALVLSGCDINKSGSAIHPLAGQSGIVFTLSTQSDKPIEDIRIYGFDASGVLAIYKYYSSADALASDVLSLPSGAYTFIEILNVGADFTLDISKSAPTPSSSSSSEELPALTFSDFTAWLKEVGPLYPDMMTGISRAETTLGVVTRIVADVKNGTEGLNTSMLRLNIKLPQQELPDYAVKNPTPPKVDGYKWRVAVEIYQRGSAVAIYRHNEILNSSSTLDLNLLVGDYDILLWTDYVPVSKTHVADHYYTTSSLKGVEFSQTTPYAANTDTRNAYSLAFEATVSADSAVTDQTITLARTFAKYRIIATDIQKYLTLLPTNGFPPLQDLMVTVSYNGHLPNRFDVSSGNLTNTTDGVMYNNSIYDITKTTATVGSDYVFATSTESSVNVNVTITNKDGKKISQVSGVKINYRPDHLTTVSGAFLTAGVTTSGITVNTEWGGNNYHEF